MQKFEEKMMKNVQERKTICNKRIKCNCRRKITINHVEFDRQTKEEKRGRLPTDFQNIKEENKRIIIEHE